MKARVLIADDHALIAEGIAGLLRPEFDVIGICLDGRQLLQLTPLLKPDVVTLDLGMPEMNGLEAARQLSMLYPSLLMVCVTQQVEIHYLQAALQAGVKGFVSKQSASGELLEAMRRVLLHDVYITPALRSAHEQALAAGTGAHGNGVSLTERQRQILQMIADGRTTKEIAYDLNISSKTVEFHRAAIMRVLGLHSVAELTRYALKHGISVP